MPGCLERRSPVLVVGQSLERPSFAHGTEKNAAERQRGRRTVRSLHGFHRSSSGRVPHADGVERRSGTFLCSVRTIMARSKRRHWPTGYGAVGFVQLVEVDITGKHNSVGAVAWSK